MKRNTAKVTAYIAGALLFAFGAYVGVENDGDWNLWAAVMSGGPIALALVLSIPGALDRGLDAVAPYVPFLHDHDEDE